MSFEEIISLVSEENREMIYEVMAHPVLVEAALEIPIDMEFPNTDKVVFTGIGTSGLTGEFMKTYFENVGLPIQFRVYRSQDVPIDNESLYIVYSYSGTTLETLQSLMKVHKHGIKPYVISTGGYLELYARKHNLPFVKIKIPEIENVRKLETRSHLPFGVTFFARIFSEIFNVKEQVERDLKEALEVLKKLLDNIGKMKDFLTTTTKKIAESTLPVILADNAISPVARRFRNQLCENAKKISMWDVFPEMGHNLLCALKEEAERALLIVYKRNSADEITKKYYEILDVMFAQNNIIYINICDEKYSWGTLLEPVFISDILSILVGDYLGRKTKPIRQVDIVKEKLKEVVSLP